MAHSRPVTSAVYPFLAVRIEVRGHWHEALALLDTGFDGELAVPAGLQPVGLGQPDDSVDWALADGSVLTAPLYFGTLEIVGLPPMPAIVTVLGLSTSSAEGSSTCFGSPSTTGDRSSSSREGGPA